MFEPRYCPSCSHVLARRDVEGTLRPACGACDFVYYLDPKVAVAVLVPKDGGILLGLRAIDPGLGLWSFPSGYVDRGEVLEEAAAREVLEETGLNVQIQGLVGVYSSPGEAVVVAVYAGQITGGLAEPGPEMSELRAFPLRALPQMAFSHDRRIADDYERFLEVRELLRRQPS